ncbi:MAG: glutamate synthase [Candidatus Eisenbacteria bacterium]|nr:glutamate synthase [Candidatus Eisenbacteria bacterium]
MENLREEAGALLGSRQEETSSLMNTRQEQAGALLDSRAKLIAGVSPQPDELRAREAAEGGCGVLGFAANVPIAGRHIVTASQQMHNRGNGKGGGIAAAGLDPAQMRVSPDVLRTHYLIQVAYLDRGARAEVERECLTGRFDITESYRVETLDDHRAVPGLEVRPPDVVRYFCRVKPEALAHFAEENALRHLPARQVEDEYVYQNTFRLNQRYYAGLDDKRAFVLCHGRDLLVFKIVGYAEQAAVYYRLENLTAHVWISHQRYPTKGRIWHPGGAHPFIGMNEALVHNGDFANYHRVTEYLRLRNIVPLFLTDTEVSVLLFDLWDRVYAYPLEVLLEALAPTTERDFDMLPPEKQTLYRAIQQTHLHGSPDGPWFFIIARSKPDTQTWELLGVTDTSMLRPQVFALYESSPPPPTSQNNRDESSGGRSGASEPLQAKTENVQIGLIASERQAINACLRSLAVEDARFQPEADKYWVARGGSYTDGGAFVLTVSKSDEGYSLTCRDKFGKLVATPAPGASTRTRSGADWMSVLRDSVTGALTHYRGSRAGDTDSLTHDADSLPSGASPLASGAGKWFAEARESLAAADLSQVAAWTDWLAEFAREDDTTRACAIDVLTLLRDRHYDTGIKRRSALLATVDRSLYHVLRNVPGLDSCSESTHRLVDWRTRQTLRSPGLGELALVVDACDFPAEGEESAARLLCRAHSLGWRRFITLDWRGGRFAGCGLGSNTDDVRLDVFGDNGDYLGSGLDGASVFVHGAAQDQVGQILKRGRLVIHGDVGQTFLYGAKGGDIFVLGSAAGRPLINAVGRPRTVINGTCLDYLAESFMAGDPMDGGGFVIVNGVTFDETGGLIELDTPYPGGNLFSLASGGAIYLRDPHGKVEDDQLNGGQFAPLSDPDWRLIDPYLRQNESLFGIKVDDLLRVDGEVWPPNKVYRKVGVASVNVLHY